MSLRTTSGSSRPILASASSIERYVPTQRKPSVPSMSIARPSRISRRSSTTATRIGFGDDSVIPLSLARFWILVPAVDLVTTNLCSCFLPSGCREPVERHAKHDSRASPRLRPELECAADPRCSFAHAHEAVTVALADRIEAASVVAQAELQVIRRHPKVDLGLAAAGVADHVVDALLEDQKDLAAQVCAERYVLFPIRQA